MSEAITSSTSGLGTNDYISTLARSMDASVTKAMANMSLAIKAVEGDATNPKLLSELQTATTTFGTVAGLQSSLVKKIGDVDAEIIRKI
ncbi:EscF/YscF/HrpA family type III secretion system needle major subunit [Herbaspirillum sp. RTI4]|uniref:EscF/YscF/HrpA family type III secretion system needle major subunit n=1 Tax=Herbaspirillum sp. RTI4 TaxID=3048640 RepID=UPI002AB52E12|nr:EscF/YscF/HrpA family type III secretion system needle major subunit [Herbaspirillum sp. RTI4]MDY7578355.1 EscF/YscF/HrpA family type III secretion system needle major subunit [Herbaspirillum sp. RTI4]MEA9981152.1 EscF/YscF/HrpA family type III secretion system needle major subunit [Herbaspirillum sp. RTI4]